MKFGMPIEEMIIELQVAMAREGLRLKGIVVDYETIDVIALQVGMDAFRRRGCTIVGPDGPILVEPR